MVLKKKLTILFDYLFSGWRGRCQYSKIIFQVWSDIPVYFPKHCGARETERRGRKGSFGNRHSRSVEANGEWTMFEKGIFHTQHREGCILYFQMNCHVLCFTVDGFWCPPCFLHIISVSIWNSSSVIINVNRGIEMSTTLSLLDRFCLVIYCSICEIWSYLLLWLIFLLSIKF